MELGPNQRIFVKALKSGEYEQCQGSLREEKDGKIRYCCLGVADHLFKLNASDNETLDGTDYKNVLGLYGPDGPINNTFANYKNSALVLMNDEGGLTFSEIAEYIEKYPELVFSKSV